MQSSQPIHSFGIELEMIAVHPETAFTHNIPGLVPCDTSGLVNARLAVCHLFNNVYDIPAIHQEDDDVSDTPEEYSRWCVKADGLTLSNNEQTNLPAGYTASPVELASRILLSTDNWRKEIRRVLRALRDIERRFDCRFITNQSCGLHVHLGKPEERVGLPFHTAKRLFQLATAHEHNFDRLHASHRIVAREYPRDFLVPYMPPSFFHRMNGTFAEDDKTINFIDWLRELELCKDEQQLTEFTTMPEDIANPAAGWFESGNSAAYNFDNLCDGIEAKKTVELRQHAGSLDLTDITSIVELYLRLAAYCEAVDDVSFLQLLLAGTRPPFGLRELLIEVGCRRSLVAFLTRREEAGESSSSSSSSSSSPSPPPCPPRSPGNPLLNHLLAHNARENASTTSPDAIRAAIDAKRYALVQGTERPEVSRRIQTVGVFPTRYELTQRLAEAEAAMQPEFGPWTRVAARALVLDFFAEGYAAQAVGAGTGNRVRGPIPQWRWTGLRVQQQG